MSNPGAIVVMGVSGSGKSTIAAALADRLGVPYIDADDLHPASNLLKMRSGLPLDDDDRLPWLVAVGQGMADSTHERGVVVACSALRRSYRDVLRANASRPIAFVHLEGDSALIQRRLAERRAHFMPAALLPSQFTLLEMLHDDESGLVISVDAEVAQIVAAVVDYLGSTTHLGRRPG